MPHMRHPPSVVSSCCLVLNGFSSSVTCAGHPRCMYERTLLSILSFLVTVRMSLKVTGRACTCATLGMCRLVSNVVSICLEERGAAPIAAVGLLPAKGLLSWDLGLS